jgi:xanthine/uracil permease
MQKPTPTPHPPPPPTPVILLKAFPPNVIGMMMLQVALVIFGLCVAAIYVGRQLDAQWNTAPWASVGLLVLAALLSLVIIYRLGLRTVKKAEIAYAKWQAETQQTTNTQPPTHP